MKISKIKVENYRLLKSLELDLEDNLSLIIGKNNCGKTSLLCILDKFIGKKSGVPIFAYDDFNLDFQKELETIYTTDKYLEVLRSFEEDNDDNKWKNIGISLKLFIEYTDSDSLANISKLMMDLDPNNRTIVLLFEYILDLDNFRRMKIDFDDYQLINKEKEVSDGNNIVEDHDLDSLTYKVKNKTLLFNEFMKSNSKNYFKVLKKSISFDAETEQENEAEYINILDEKISLRPIINFNIIPANREISNKDSDKTLSSLASEYYKKKEETKLGSPEIESFKDKLKETDVFLDSVYAGIFEKVIDKVKMFGGVREGDSIISVNSTLQHRELLKDNTTVMYNHNKDCSLPENYNGLGYLNLISMIFDIELLINDFRRDSNLNEFPADINLLFIEEPEAHTHPQMQYVFIKNIKSILKEASEGGVEANMRKFQLQTLITSHSSHITSESKFDDIKYFFKEKDENSVISKNLKDLKVVYNKEDENHFKFLKQYLTLHRSELFFADKAIFIEGDTERILLPAMMRKIDQEINIKHDNIDDKSLPMLSQNISIVEVGAYSHIFEKFIDFIGLKSLIITDIDSVITKNQKCRVCDNDAKDISNYSLKYFFSYLLKDTNNNEILDLFKSLPFRSKQLRKNLTNGEWCSSNDAHVTIVYQTKEQEYHARSFEDAFIHLNKKFITDNISNFKSLKNEDYFTDSSKDSYDLANQCINKKPSFAMDILLNSNTDIEEFSNWEIPAYIKEGLLWLKRA